MQGHEHLRAQPPKKHMHELRRLLHLRAQEPKKHMHELLRRFHLRARPHVRAGSICEHMRIKYSCKDCAAQSADAP
jgi:hypothetical protein